jgi:hypothetical protein
MGDSMVKGKQIVIHYPRLDTVLMVEEAIQKAKVYPTKAQLWKSLPKKIMYQTFCLILTYLQKSNKILIDPRDGRIVWIGTNEKLERAIRKGWKVR